MDITRTRLKEIILEELSKKDKDEIKKMITKELEDMFKSKEVKEDMSEIAKKVLKKLDFNTQTLKESKNNAKVPMYRKNVSVVDQVKNMLTDKVY